MVDNLVIVAVFVTWLFWIFASAGIPLGIYALATRAKEIRKASASFDLRFTWVTELISIPLATLFAVKVGMAFAGAHQVWKVWWLFASIIGAILVTPAALILLALEKGKD